MLKCDPIISLAKLLVIFGTFPGIRVSILSQVPPLNTVLNKVSIDVPINLHNPVKSHVLSAKITLCLKVAATVTFSAGPPPTLDLHSLYSLNQMTKIIESLSNKDSNKLSPAWVRFIQSLNIVASNARKISEVRKSAIPYPGCPY